MRIILIFVLMLSACATPVVSVKGGMLLFTVNTKVAQDVTPEMKEITTEVCSYSQSDWNGQTEDRKCIKTIHNDFTWIAIFSENEKYIVAVFKIDKEGKSEAIFIKFESKTFHA